MSKINSARVSRKRVPKNKLYKEYIELVNYQLMLSPREVQVLDVLMGIDVNWEPKYEGQLKNIIDRDFRKYIMKETFINKNNLSMYLKHLKEKNVLISPEKGSWIINPLFIPAFDDNGKFTVIFELISEE